jgi:hypothetical protein
MNNKKALAKTFWNIWEWWWVGWGNIGEWILEDLFGERWIVMGMRVRVV